MPKFDKFKYYFDHKAEYDDEYYAAQMFYWHYVKPFGYDFIEEYISTLTRLVKQDFKRILAMSMEFEKDCQEMFDEMCEELKIARDTSNVLPLVPFDWGNINAYVGPAYADYFGKGNLVFSLALLITFDQYTDIVFDDERIEGLLYLIKRSLKIDENITNAIRERTYKHCRKLFGDNIVKETEEQASDISKDNGDFILPWKYVEFMNGKIFLYHPAEYGNHSTHPLRIENKKSKIAMNYIKRYLSGKCAPLSVHSEHGVLTKLNNNDDLLKSVDILNERLKAAAIARKPKSRSPFHKQMSAKEITHKLREYKSIYLDFLCDHQLAEYNIVYCPENRVNEETQADEDSFVFTIENAYSKVKIVFENTLDKRSSIVVECYERQYKNAIKRLSEYFASEIVNKRENISKLRDKMARHGATIRKVIHTNFEAWKESVMR